MATPVEPPKAPARRHPRQVVYSWNEYLDIIRMMTDGNTLPDDFLVAPPLPEAKRS